MADFRYRYDAIVREVYDGDTIYADIDLGLDTWKHDIGLRLYGIDTPEVRTLSSREAGIAARDFICAALLGIPLEDVGNLPRKRRGSSTRIVLGAVPIFLHSHGDDDGKYGRLLAEIFVPLGDELVHINKLMLTSGHAKVPSYL